nr:lipocalin family protein [uncultured Flavobacterium sp.]
MKRILSLLLFIGLFSCTNSSETVPDDTSGNIEGVWQLSAKYSNGVRQNLSNCNLKEKLQFQEDSLFIASPAEMGNNICNVETKKAVFSVTNNVLSIKISEENTNAKIKELTKTKLVLVSEDFVEISEYERQ